jgi:hypothetical protein
MWAQGTGPAEGVDERLMAAVGGSALLAASLQRCSRAVASSEAELRALGLFRLLRRAGPRALSAGL